MKKEPKIIVVTSLAITFFVLIAAHIAKMSTSEIKEDDLTLVTNIRLFDSDLNYYDPINLGCDVART